MKLIIINQKFMINSLFKKNMMIFYT